MNTNSSTKNKRESCRSLGKAQALGVGIIFYLFAALFSPAFAADDDVPFFAGANGAPNIMFIFDNSDSMQDIPYLRADGRPVRPGTKPNSTNNTSTENWSWRQGVKLNADNTVMEVNGNVQYDYNAFPTDTEMSIPEQTPANLPGTDPASLESTADVNDPLMPVAIPEQTLAPLPQLTPAPPLASTMTSIPNTARIYDTTLDWTTAGTALTNTAIFNATYRYKIVKVVSSTGTVQERTITGRNTSSKYFDIDTTAAAGGPLVYIAGEAPYTYTIQTGQSSTGANTGRIYDSSLNWTDPLLADTTTFNVNFLHRLVKVVSSTGTVQERTITGRDTTNQFFYIDTAVAAGGPLVYNNAERPYTYTILADGPGRVTRGVTSTTTVYDADINWGSITSDWIGKQITVTAGSAANVGQTRTISGYSTGNKYWTVSAGFPTALNNLTSYVIKNLPSNTSRIYDASLDWTTAGTSLSDATLFEKNYRYRIIRLVSDAGTVQERTILTRSTSGKYFEVDTSASAGGPLVYLPEERPYTYSILTDGPGRVTRVRTDNLRYVTDADFDWSTINSWSDFSPKWQNRALVITAGPNKDLKRLITGYSVSEKRWELDTAFPVACDLNTRFKIIGTPDDNRLAFGGNHPASKLYQAKKAINLFLADPTLKTCVSTDATGACQSYEFALNMGFATYLSARVPRVTAKYYRKVPGTPATGGVYIDPPPYDPPPVPARACGYYKSTSSQTSTFLGPTSGSVFTSTGWKTAPSGSTSWITSQVHTGVSVGYKFDRLYREGSCDQQVMKYTVTGVVPDPTDGLPDQHKFTVTGTSWSVSQRCFNVASCAALPLTDGSRTLVPSGSPCYSVCTFTAAYDNPPVDPPPYTTPIVPGTSERYLTEYRDTYGFYNVTTAGTPRYVDRLTHLVTPWPGYIGTSWNTNLTPNPDNGDWTLMTTPLIGKPIDTAGTLSDIQPNTYDTSYFMYPGYNTADRPHGWSYKKTSGTPATPVTDPPADELLWIYGQSDSWSGADFPKVWAAGASNPSYPWPGNAGGWVWSTWGDSIQNDPYFPAVLGDEMANFSGDDQTVFVNLPVYDGSAPAFGDDIAGQNIDKILDYTDLTRFPSPDNSSSWAQSFDYTIMPYSRSIAPNAYSAIKGVGTPIAASLQDLKKYYDAYIQQDSLTQGGCRKNYVIFLTDGIESAGGDPVQAAADLLALKIDEDGDGIGDKAFPIKTYVIGFGLDADSQANLNAIAAAGGTLHAYFANNVESLVGILVGDITSSIIGDSYSRSSPVGSTDTPGVDLSLYGAHFDYPSWQGHLKGYRLDPDTGDVAGPLTGWSGDCNGNGAPDGDAGCEMSIHGRGTVYTSIFNAGSIQRLDFDPDNAASITSLITLINPLGVDIDGVGGPNQDADAATVMRYTLDSGYDSDKYRGTRDPDWPLGDIYHSEMVVVGAPSFIPPLPPAVGADPYAGYIEFRDSVSLKTRQTRIYVGANDGMVHAFKATNGQEDWAYIPNSVLGKLYEMGWPANGGGGHRFTVDLPLVAADIYSPGGKPTTIWDSVAPGHEEDGWHTLLTSGLRDGGYSYFALEITEASNPIPAWETTDKDVDLTTRDMGKTWSTPSFGRVLIDGVQTSVIFVGGGISAAENTGNNFYILDAGSGAILKELPIGSSTNHVPSEILVVADNDKSSPYFGNVIAAYFGDTSGDLWKVTSLNDDLSGTAWDPLAVLLHDGEGKVFHKPAISQTKGGCIVTVEGIDYTINPNTNFIFYGTGDEEDPTNLGTTDRIYEIADPALSPVAITDPVTPPLRKIWERQFPVGQKMLTDPFIQLGSLIFIAYTPEGGCGRGGSYLWEISTTKCGDPGNTIIRYVYLGSGITSSMTSMGPVGFYQGGDSKDENNDGVIDDFEKMTHQTTLPNTNKIEYWRENF